MQEQKRPAARLGPADGRSEESLRPVVVVARPRPRRRGAAVAPPPLERPVEFAPVHQRAAGERGEEEAPGPEGPAALPGVPQDQREAAPRPEPQRRPGGQRRAHLARPPPDLEDLG